MRRISVDNVRDLILSRAASYGDREYLIFKDQSFSFIDLERRSRQVARGLSDLGVKKGDRVAVIIANRPVFLFVWWGLLRIGAVMVPINLKLTGGEIAHIINHAEAKAVVLGRTFRSKHVRVKGSMPESGLLAAGRQERWVPVGGRIFRPLRRSAGPNRSDPLG